MITILGPTASGKTTLSCAVAARTNGEIISADSRQVYRGMDIGTGKDIEEYEVAGNKIPYHLIDIHPAGYEYNIFQFQRDFLQAYNSVLAKENMPIMCGGSGLYLEAVLRAYHMVEVPPNPKLRQELEAVDHAELVKELLQSTALHNSTDISSKKRTIRAIEIARHCKQQKIEPTIFPKIPSTNFGLKWERDVLKNRITERLTQRVESGMIEEVQKLLDSGLTFEQIKFYGLEYKFVARHLEGELSKNDMVDRLNIAIHQFSKRQMTWFRKMEKVGIVIHWLNGEAALEENTHEILRITNTP